MKKYIIAILSMIIFLVACGADHTGQAKTPSGSSVQKGRDYMAVESDFKEKGFTNIKYELIEDLITGWLTKDGEVEKVTVGGDPEYSPDKWVAADIEVVIYYHTFPVKKEKEKEVESEVDVAFAEAEESNEEVVEEVVEEIPKDVEEIEVPKEEVETEGITEEETEVEEKNSNEMPILKGSSLEAAVKKASEYGVIELYDDDFGHGTRCKDLSDSNGGLNLKLIYNTETKELLCGRVVTNLNASSESQKKFAKGMCELLCPSADASEVSNWVTENVGKEAKKVISGVTYEVELGPVDNVIFYAGTSEWDDWESQYW